MERILLSTSEAAEILNLSTRTLDRMRTSGDGPVYVQVRRRIGYLPDDLEAFVQAARRRSTSDQQAAE